MAVSKSVEMTTMGKQYDTRTECPIPESRTVRPNRIFPRKISLLCRGRFGIILFTHTRNIPTRARVCRQPSVTRACRMHDFDFATHADASASAGSLPHGTRCVSCCFLNTPFGFTATSTMSTRASTRRHASTATLGGPSTRRRRGVVGEDDARTDLSRADARAPIGSTLKKVRLDAEEFARVRSRVLHRVRCSPRRHAASSVVASGARGRFGGALTAHRSSRACVRATRATTTGDDAGFDAMDFLRRGFRVGGGEPARVAASVPTMRSGEETPGAGRDTRHRLGGKATNDDDVDTWRVFIDDETVCTYDDDDSQAAVVVSKRSAIVATTRTTTTPEIAAAKSSFVSEETEEISLGELFEEYERAFGGDAGVEDALDAIQALPAPPRDVSSSALYEEEMNGFDAVHEESTVPFIAPEWLERSGVGKVESAGSDNEEEGDDAENAEEYAGHVRASKFLEDEEEEFMRSTMDLPADFISEPAALAARREARERALKSSQTCFEATAKSAMTTCEPFEGAFEPKMTMRRCESAQDFNEQYTCTAADGRVFHISSSLVTPSTSEADFVGGYGRSQLEDSAKGGGGTDAEDSDAELVAQSKRKGGVATPEKPSKKRKALRRPDENGRRAKAYKTIKNDKGVRATDVVTANGKKVRRGCLHCGTIKTPQWRMGPEGKKTLCNACGVRFMKGIL